MNKKLPKTVLTVFLLATLTVTLFACNKNNFSISDIYVSSESPSEIDGYKQEFALPANWSVYTTSKTTSSSTTADNVNSDVGYIKSIDAFVVKYNGAGEGLSVVRCNDSKIYFEGGFPGMLFPADIGISAIRYKDGLFAVKFSNGDGGAFDIKGRTVLSRSAVTGIGSATINSAVKILDGGLIAVNRSYCSGPAKSTAIFRPTLNGTVSERKNLVCYVKNDAEKLDYVLGFDNNYVSVIGNEDVNYMYYIPQAASSEIPVLSGGNSGKISSNKKDDYFCEITYIGEGRFFVHEDWTVNESDDYTYYDNTDYYVVSRHIYRPQNDTISDYTDNADFIFLNLTNKYYDKSKADIDVNGFLQDGLMYASYGLFIADKIAYYDQYILDSDLNITVSLSGNLGVELKRQKVDEISYFDLIMEVVDGYAYVPLLPSNMHIYDDNGNLVASNTKYTVISQYLSDGLLLAQIVDPEDADETLWGAFDMKGNIAVPFIYTELTTFRGYYAVGKRKDEGTTKIFLVGKDGSEVKELSDGSVPFADIARKDSTSGGYIYTNGCYMFVQKVDGVNLYGIKNLNANTSKNTVMSAKMAVGSILYAPSSSPKDIFVFEKITNADSSVSYTVYRLTSSDKSDSGKPDLGAIIGGTIGGIVALGIIAAVLLVLKKKGILFVKTSDSDTSNFDEPKDKNGKSKDKASKDGADKNSEKIETGASRNKGAKKAEK